VDFYNPFIYPGDFLARQAIRAAVEIRPTDSDERYLQLLEQTLDRSIAEFHPDLIVYNAGTDCLIGDPLGNLSLSRQAIISRDWLVFQAAQSNSVPVVMLLSGGYQQSNAPVIADSIRNLMEHLDS
jgi:histone deacetylase 11